MRNAVPPTFDPSRRTVTRGTAAFALSALALLLPPTLILAADPSPTDPAATDTLIKPSDRQHWSFQPARRPAVPAVKDSAWPRNPIDNFILSKLEGHSWQPPRVPGVESASPQSHSWRPAPPAAPRALLRRLYLDITGLPPTLAEQDAFLKDPAATDKLIDDLLSRPTYGERWARHWLDLVRFAETNGYERDATKPNVWRYRDYVINSLNADKPYDRFILEQLAGDELPDASTETLIATGYYRLGPWDDEPADPAEDRFDQLDDMVATTSQVFLGLTLACARCHNHKFDPLTQLDYYRMVATFNGLQRRTSGRTELDLPAGSRAQLAALADRDRQIQPFEEHVRRLRADFRTWFLIYGQSKLPPDALAAFRTDPARRNDAQKKLADKHAPELDKEVTAALPESTRHEIEAAQAKIRHLREQTPDLPRGYFLHEPSPNPPPTHLLLRGKAASPGPQVAPGLPAVLVSSQPPQLPPTQYTALRRLALARWLASPENPLTARVLVNRVWQFHFGEGLVRTPSDFGTQGDEPTHPELLDYLADWFVRDARWSLKKLHRLILTSNTYRMSTRGNPTYRSDDPEDLLLWHFPYHRLDVEAIRDSALAASGQLNPKMLGPSMYPDVPKAALEGHSDPDKIWPAFDEREASRRTVYAFTKRSLIVPMLEVLDFCDTTRSSAKRLTTTVAPQALSLFNGDFINRQARHLADRLLREVGPDPDKQIDRAYLLALSRPPTPTERRTMLQFLTAETARLASEAPSGGTGGSPTSAADATAASTRTDPQTDPRHAALVQLCRVIFNLNEFAYPD